MGLSGPFQVVGRRARPVSAGPVRHGWRIRCSHHLGRWCHDHRRWVLGHLDPRPRRRRARRPRAGHRVPLRVHPARRGEPSGHGDPRRALRRRGGGPVRHHRLPGRPARDRPCGAGADGGLPRPGRPDRRRERRQPVRPRRGPPHLHPGRRRRPDRLRRGPAPAGRHLRGRPGHRRATSDALAAKVDGPTSTSGARASPSSRTPPRRSWASGFAIVILILAFGSVLAMGLPIGVALFGIGLGTLIVGLLSHVVTVPDFATVLGRDDRPRRRHRLRAVHRHPVPRGAARRPRPPGTRPPSPSTPPAGPWSSPAPPWSSPCWAC